MPCAVAEKRKDRGEILVIGKPMVITAFSFTHTGMSTEQCFLYSAEQTEDGIRLYTEQLFSGGLIVDTIVDETVLERLDEIAAKYRLDGWDGFDKNNGHVMDGYNFSLSVTFADGKTISAHGSNSFPEGYDDAKRPFSMYQYVGEQRNIEIAEDETVSVVRITKEQLDNS